MTKIGLGIDAGGTATRWCLADAAGVVTASGATAPMTGHVYSDELRARMTSIIAGLAMAVTAHGKPDAVFAGITGLDAGTPAADFYQHALAEALDRPVAAVTIDNDMGLAYRAAFAVGTGILVYTGTGSVACHLTADGIHVRAGGRGVIIDDAGSGFWIAREGIKLVLRQEDWQPGSGWSSPLGQALAGALGGASWDLVRARVYAGDRGQVAMLARQVAEAADAGDTRAQGVFDHAGQELGDLARALLGRLGPRPVVLAGGAAELHPRLLAAFLLTLSGETAEFRRLVPSLAGAKTAAARASGGA